MEKRFGIPRSVFDDYLLFKKKKSWWLLRDSGFIRTGTQLKVWRVGLKAFQEVGDFIKPTTRMIQLFGHKASTALMEISEKDLGSLARGEFIPCQGELENGYIILCLEKRVLGLGLLIDGLVRSQIPRKDMKQFVNSLSQK
jgi:NOL1/NOP2/fmu family ribosome biogenesis protein